MNSGWDRVPLHQLLFRSEERICLNSKEKYREVTVRLWGKGVILRREVTGAEIASNNRFVVRAEQFIISRIDARNGAFGLVPDSLDGAIVTNDFPIFNLNIDRLFPPFLEWMSKTYGFVDLCKAASEGTTNRIRLKEERFLAADIYLPPLAEQCRIVARIEEIAARIEEARGLRRDTTTTLGQLTRKNLEDWFDSFVKKYGFIKLGELILDAGYGTSVKCQLERSEKAIRVLRIPNVASESINFNGMKYGILSESEMRRLLIEEGDILIVRTNGSSELVGRCAVVPRVFEPTAFASYLIRLRCNRETIDPHYLQWTLRHLRLDGQLFDLARTTAGQFNVSLGRLQSAKIPVPKIEEQRYSVDRLNNMQAKVDALIKLQAQAAAELDALLPSILDKAFKGEL
jgi:type I restriction enzyme, S subunit